ncbi:MAG: 3'-phosphoadenosine 5'-phosphosulfate (PAPS) 3'-phosphatase [Moritella sp.]|jgi:3'-phosphoadenosine 5'-phosphosulfate (PAPS) 3'-phosphatase
MITFTAEQLQQLLQLATQAALSAGRYINQFDRTQLLVQHKQSGASLSAQVVTQVDLDSQALILAILQPSTEQYDIALLTEENASEEGVAEHDRFRRDYFWCIDPLDGTLPFIEGNDGFAVSIALVDRTGKPVIGVVHHPRTGDTYQAINALPVVSGVLKNTQPWQPKIANRVLTLYIDRSFAQDPVYPAYINKMTAFSAQQGLGGLNIVNARGAVMNAIGVLENAPACYAKLPKKKRGGGSLWDFSATAAITQALANQAQGLVTPTCRVSDTQGEELDLNRSDSNYMNHRGVCYSCGIDNDVLLDLLADLYARR